MEHKKSMELCRQQLSNQERLSTSQGGRNYKSNANIHDGLKKLQFSKYHTVADVQDERISPKCSER